MNLVINIISGDLTMKKYYTDEEFEELTAHFGANYTPPVKDYSLIISIVSVSILLILAIIYNL